MRRRRTRKGIEYDPNPREMLTYVGMVDRVSPSVPKTRLWRCMAVVLGMGTALILWWAYWWPATTRAIAALFDPGYLGTIASKTIDHAGPLLADIKACVLIAVVAAAACALLRFRGPARLHTVFTASAWDLWPHAGLRTMLKTCLAYVGLLAGVDAIQGFIGQTFDIPLNSYPYQSASTPELTVLNIFDGMMAGPAEELALLALPVLALRKARIPWLIVGVVAVLLRIPFHMYYGWGELIAILWPIGAVILLRRTGAVWGIVAGHAAHNLIASCQALTGDWGIVVAVGHLGLFITAIIVVVRAFGNIPKPVADRWRVEQYTRRKAKA